MLINPNPDQFFELPGGYAQKFEIVYLVPSFQPDGASLNVVLYKTAEDYNAGVELNRLALGAFDCMLNDPDIWDKSHAFALETFTGFEVAE